MIPSPVKTEVRFAASFLSYDPPTEEIECNENKDAVMDEGSSTTQPHFKASDADIFILDPCALSHCDMKHMP